MLAQNVEDHKSLTKTLFEQAQSYYNKVMIAVLRENNAIATNPCSDKERRMSLSIEDRLFVVGSLSIVSENKPKDLEVNTTPKGFFQSEGSLVTK